MIGSIRGKVIEATPVTALIEVGGIGYEVFIPVTTAERLPPPGGEAYLYTRAIYREDDATLYGFARRDERDFFRLLVEKVSGIGPKLALNLMSRLSLETLRGAIAQGDTQLLSKCPGIGKRTAERLIVDLRDKVFPGAQAAGVVAAQIADEATSTTGSVEASSPHVDAVAALVTLGHKPPDADALVRKALRKIGEDATTEAILKEALR